MALALCHTIITERINGVLTYNASSPDELALVNFAKFSGYEYMGTDDDNYMKVKVKDIEYKYKLLNVLEFNSSRKRQSVILRDP
jgi:phospholipid-transporting ATPase